MISRKRIYSAVTFALASAVVLSGCSQGSGSSGPGETTTIDAWTRSAGQAAFAEVVDQYNASQDAVQIKLTVVPDDQFVQKFGSAAATGSAPDLLAIDTARVQYFASVGALSDVTEQLSQLPYAEDFSPGQLNVTNYDGADYAVPFSAEASVLFYNKTLFEQAGLDPEVAPASYEDILSAATAITAVGGETRGFSFAGAGGGANNFQLSPMIWASGGSLLSEDGMTATYDSPEVTDLLQLLRDLVDGGNVPASAATDTGPNVGPTFVSGTVGMVSNGAFFVQQLIAEDPGFDWGISVLPGQEGGASSFTGGDALAVPTGSGSPEAAWDFIEWATDREGQTVLAELGVVPVRTDLADEIYVPLDPRYAVLAEAVEVGKAPKTTLSSSLFGDPAGPLATMIHEAAYTARPLKEIQAAQQSVAQKIIDAQG